MLSKEPEAEFSSADKAQAPRVQWQNILASLKEKAQINVCESITCSVLVQPWEQDNSVFQNQISQQSKQP